MFTHEDKDNFFNAIESLKKYRRADLLDERGRNLLETLYTDLLPNDHILKKSIKENTTFLIGRKGTGKSTIFLCLEQELRKKDNYLPLRSRVWESRLGVIYQRILLPAICAAGSLGSSINYL